MVTPHATSGAAPLASAGAAPHTTAGDAPQATAGAAPHATAGDAPQAGCEMPTPPRVSAP